METGLPKGPDFFLHHSERLVQVEPLNEHTNLMTFQAGPRDLIQALRFIACTNSALRKTSTIASCRAIASCRRLSTVTSSRSTTERSFYACGGVW